MKKLFRFLIILIVITLVIGGAFLYIQKNYKDEIYLYYRDNILKVRENIKINKNEYFKNKNYKYVQNTNDFVAKDKNHLLNIFYTIINSGQETFTFYCDDSYTNCKQDIVSLIDNKDTLSSINNFVHPYNSFEKVSTTYDDYGQIDIKVEKVYSQNDILLINKKVDEIINKEIKNNMNNKQKIEAIHNYIINHGKYATDKIREKNKDKQYNKANDILLDGYGLCSSYADAMAIFLHRFGIDNYKIASDSHIWNLVNIDNKWLHLDLTWDDPITTDGKDKLEKLFLLIDNKRLKDLKVKQHEYDKNIYKEAA